MNFRLAPELCAKSKILLAPVHSCSPSTSSESLGSSNTTCPAHAVALIRPTLSKFIVKSDSLTNLSNVGHTETLDEMRASRLIYK